MPGAKVLIGTRPHAPGHSAVARACCAARRHHDRRDDLHPPAAPWRHCCSRCRPREPCPGSAIQAAGRCALFHVVASAAAERYWLRRQRERDDRARRPGQQHQRRRGRARKRVGRRHLSSQMTRLACRAAKAATATSDRPPTSTKTELVAGDVASLDRPGGKISGATVLTIGSGPSEMVSREPAEAAAIAMLAEPDNPMSRPRWKMPRRRRARSASICTSCRRH